MPEIQKDLVLSPNEYAYVLDETKGNVACNVGPHKMSLSQSDNLVKFDTKTKKFIPCDTTRSNQAVVEKIAESIAPYAVAGGQPVSRAVSELLRGTTLESVIDTLKKE